MCQVSGTHLELRVRRQVGRAAARGLGSAGLTAPVRCSAGSGRRTAARLQRRLSAVQHRGGVTPVQAPDADSVLHQGDETPLHPEFCSHLHAALRRRSQSRRLALTAACQED